MEFTADWTTGYQESWLKIFADFIGKPQVRMLEIGAHEGRSSLWWLENILTGERSVLDIVDPWVYGGGLPYVRFLGNLAESGHAIRTYIFRQPSIEYLSNCRKWYDAIYVDGNHEGSNVMTDAVLAWERLKRGGIMLFDDYHWTDHKGKRFRPPKPAIDSFLDLFGNRCEVIHHHYQVAIQKTK